MVRSVNDGAGGLYQGAIPTGKACNVSQVIRGTSGNCEAFPTTTFIGGIRVIELKGPVQPADREINTGAL